MSKGLMENLRIIRAIVTGLKTVAKEPEDRVKRLTEEDKKTLSDCINNLIWTEENKNRNLAAVYITAYWEDGTVHIYVNFVDHRYCEDDCTAVSCKVKGIIIDKVMKNAAGFGYISEETKEKLNNLQELADCIYCKAYENWNGRYWYETQMGYANKAGITKSDHTAKLEPPLTLTK